MNETEIIEDVKQPEVEGSEIEPVIMSSFTYRVTNGRILGRVDELEAMKQAIEKILMTERFIFEIYSDQYGHDLNDLIGKDMAFVKVAVEDMIKEALMSDDRVDEIEINQIEQTDRSSLLVNLTVHTLFGNFERETEVKA